MTRTGADGLRCDRLGGAAWLCAVAFGAATVPALASASASGPNEPLQPGGRRFDMLAQSEVVRTEQVARVSPLQELIAEALKNNPEINAAAHEKDAAAQRVSAAGALDAPRAEGGLISAPTQSWQLNREDTTMKMPGISQRLPDPGKRSLHADVAAMDAESAAYGYQETVNRVVRDVRLAYYDLALTDRSQALFERNRRLVVQHIRIAEARYRVGQGAQAELLMGYTQLTKMAEDLVRLNRERQSAEAELIRALGRAGEAAPIKASLPAVDSATLSFKDLRDLAIRQRPQLLGLRRLIDKNQKALDATVAGAQAMREQALSLYEAQQNELAAKLRQQIALAEQSRESLRRYETGILPQARFAVESALEAYRANRVDFALLLDSQIRVLSYEINHAGAVASLAKALAEIDQLTGKFAAGAP